MDTEYVRNLNINYERILLEHMPEKQRYQYCILNRGGIFGLLPCNLRYINGLAYLYYDISSKQNIVNIFEKKCIHRSWFRDFLESIERLKVEMRRFLLDEKGIIFFPEQIYQDIEKNTFFYMYVPYYGNEQGLDKLMEFFIEHVDYEDEELVNFVYKLYDNYLKCGYDYFGQRLFEDAKALYEETKILSKKNEDTIITSSIKDVEGKEREVFEGKRENTIQIEENNTKVVSKKGFKSLLGGYRKRTREEYREYEECLKNNLEETLVAESTVYEDEEIGRTIYLDEMQLLNEREPKLVTSDGSELKNLNNCRSCVIGKRKEDVDILINDTSVSRVHARIMKINDDMFIEDLNSTNGTYKNGVRLKPYEKRKLEENDEIKMGKFYMQYKLI